MGADSSAVCIPEDVIMSLEAAGTPMRFETRELIDLLKETPLARRRVRTDFERELWAVRDLRATVHHIVGHTDGPQLTLVDVDQMLQHRWLRDHVWDCLASRKLREQIPTYGSPSSAE
jgi:hypothetical protein